MDAANALEGMKFLRSAILTETNIVDSRGYIAVLTFMYRKSLAHKERVMDHEKRSAMGPGSWAMLKISTCGSKEKPQSNQCHSRRNDWLQIATVVLQWRLHYTHKLNTK